MATFLSPKSGKNNLGLSCRKRFKTPVAFSSSDSEDDISLTKSAPKNLHEVAVSLFQTPKPKSDTNISVYKTPGFYKTEKDVKYKGINFVTENSRVDKDGVNDKHLQQCEAVSVKIYVPKKDLPYKNECPEDETCVKKIPSKCNPVTVISQNENSSNKSDSDDEMIHNVKRSFKKYAIIKSSDSEDSSDESDKSYFSGEASEVSDFDGELEEEKENVSKFIPKSPQCLITRKCFEEPGNYPFVNKKLSSTEQQLSEICYRTPEVERVENDNFKTANTTFVSTVKKLKPVILSSDEELGQSPLLEKPRVPAAFKFSTNTELHDFKKASFLKSLSPSVPETQVDKDAVKYRQKFKEHKYELTSKLYALFNSRIFNSQLPYDMPIEWSDYLTKTAGLTKLLKDRKCSILLSTKVLDSANRLRDTLIHEMCHAAVWIISGAQVSHGPLWQTWALRCKVVFPEIKVPTRCHTYKITYKYIYQCNKCEYEVGRHSKSLNTEKYKCGKCGGHFYLSVRH